MKAGLAAVGLVGLFAAAAAAAAPPPPTPPQNGQGRCVSHAVQDRFRELAEAEALAREIVDSCMPPHRSARESDPGTRARFDELYAAETRGRRADKRPSDRAVSEQCAGRGLGFQG